MVPARAGSQGLKNKNIRNLCGRPLIDYSISPALKSRLIDDVYINSDSTEYCEIGESLGAKSFYRKAASATSTATMKSVVSNFVSVLKEEGEEIGAVVVLYPTYPFRLSIHLDEIIESFLRVGGGRPLVGLKHPDTHPYLCLKETSPQKYSTVLDYDINKLYRRQDYPEYKQLSMWSLVTPASRIDDLNSQMFTNDTIFYDSPHDAITVDIDALKDFEFAEFLMTRYPEYSHN